MQSDRDSPRSLGDRLSSTRRGFLAAGASAVTAGLAGCSAVVDYLSGLVLDDVNVFNETDRQLTGTIEVTDPDDAVVLDDAFDVAANEGDDDEDAMAQYGGVLVGEGEYGVTVALDDAEIDGESGVETTIDVANPGDEHLLVGLGVPDIDEPISVIIVETLRDLEEHEEA